MQSRPELFLLGFERLIIRSRRNVEKMLVVADGRSCPSNFGCRAGSGKDKKQRNQDDCNRRRRPLEEVHRKEQRHRRIERERGFRKRKGQRVGDVEGRSGKGRGRSEKQQISCERTNPMATNCGGDSLREASSRRASKEEVGTYSHHSRLCLAERETRHSRLIGHGTRRVRSSRQGSSG